MKVQRHIFIALLFLCSTTACFKGSTNTDDANDAAGTGDDDRGREVSGTWLLSTDYNYDQRCNYLPVEFVRSQFKLDESIDLAKYDLPDGCEVRWNDQKVGFYFQKGSPFESTFQSEYAFDKAFQPQRVAKLDAETETPGVKEGSYHGPNPEGTVAEHAIVGASGKTAGESSLLKDSTILSTPMEAEAAPKIAAPAQRTPTGVPVSNIGDKAIWEPQKQTLHVLYLNHVLNVRVQMKGSPQAAREGAILLARYLIGHLHNASA